MWNAKQFRKDAGEGRRKFNLFKAFLKYHSRHLIRKLVRGSNEKNRTWVKEAFEPPPMSLAPAADEATESVCLPVWSSGNKGGEMAW